MYHFKAKIEIIGINPFVFVPEKVLKGLFKDAGKDKSPIRVKGHINGYPFNQSLVRFKGAWRLYINTTMLKNSPQRISEIVQLSIAIGEQKEILKPHSLLEQELNKNKIIREHFAALSTSRQQEIIRYISGLKTEESIKRNVGRVVSFLKGEQSFMGRSTG